LKIAARDAKFSIYNLCPISLVEEVLANADFSNTEKDEGRDAADKDAVYCRISKCRAMVTAKNAQRLFSNFIIEQQIFMASPLHTLLQNSSMLLSKALTAYQSGTRNNDVNLEIAGLEALDKVSKTIPAIQEAIQDRLCCDAAGAKLEVPER
jgi:hypothetical protein